ncbi:NAD-dependent protein deacylase-like [Sycon ciliatum]|uniref:NAD-dependent protein deacylase-like n=1 Tax=Sycon ciliatum TaxID=27933 RepID=UPI0031F65A44
MAQGDTSMTTLQANIVRAAAAVKNSSALLVCAGAGMGVDSGLPDFRGPEGLWKAYPPLKKRGLTLPSISTPHWFEDDPAFAWGFFGHRMNLYNATTPHGGFNILRRWGGNMKLGHAVYTSNIDGHFQRAGFAEELVEECHGSLQFLQCCQISRPGTQECPKSEEIWPADNGVRLEVDEATLNAKTPLPSCPGCGGLSRPNVLMFMDDTWVPDRTEMQGKLVDAFIDKMLGAKEAFVVVEIGAGLAVPTVRMKSEYTVRQGNGTLIRINPREPEVPGNGDHVSLAIGGLDALQRIDAILESSAR